MITRYNCYLFLFVCSFLGFCSLQGQQKKQLSQKPEVYYDEEFDMTVAPCQGELELIYFPRPKLTLEKFAAKERYKYLINACYFSGTRLLAKPVGWLKLNGKKIGKLSKSRQLTHIVCHDTAGNKITFIPWKKFRTSADCDFEFQAGPLIIENNQIAQEDIHRSLNGRGKYTRSLLAVTASNKIFFITFRNPVSLSEAAEKILSLQQFKKHRINVINLDGGASVAFYSRDYQNYNYNTEDHLPMLLGVR